jgi:hypothetical protein
VSGVGCVGVGRPAEPPFRWVGRHATALTVPVGCEMWTLCGLRVRMTELPGAEQYSCVDCVLVWAAVEATASGWCAL